MRLLLSLTLAITGIMHTSAHAESSKERWEGYRGVDSPEVQSLNLVFQYFAENAVLDMETVGMTNAPGEAFKVIDVETVPKETTKDVLSNVDNIIPWQIETCRKQGLRYCPTLSYSTNGTMFFNNGRFVTCRHSFHNWISLASQLNGGRPVSQISPPIILRVLRKGKTYRLYNSGYDGKPQMQFKTINDDPRINYQMDLPASFPTETLATIAAQSDYTELTLSKSIVRDFVMAERKSGMNNLKQNEETFLLGYPAKTKAFGDGKGDAPGFVLMVSNGRAQAPLSYYNLLRTTNYATPGMSGGVIVTADGELAGLHCNGDGIGQPSENPSTLGSYSYPLDVDLMRAYWKTLPYPSEQQLAEVRKSLPQVSSTNN